MGSQVKTNMVNDVNKLLSKYFALILSCSFWHISAHAKDLGIAGATYPIAEKDALAEIEERAKQVDWEKVIKKDKMEKCD